MLLALACAGCISRHAIADSPALIDIPPGQLTQDLRLLSDQSGAQFVYSTDQLKGIETRGAHGEYTAAKAVAKLLKGTPLAVVARDGGAFLIAQAVPAAAARNEDGIANNSSVLVSPTSAHRGSTYPTGGLRPLHVADAAGSVTTVAASQTGTAQSAATLQEIVVTAAKFNENVMNSPLSLTAINGDQLQEQHITNWQDLQFVVPGLSVQTTPAGSTFNIRGIGDSFVNPNISQGVPVYRDGVLVPLSIGDEPLWDIANVQVLRGPQGTLTGANSVGGAIFINEVDPTLKSTNGYFSVLGGNYHHLQSQGAITLPVSDAVAIRVGAYVDRRDSFSRNLTEGGFYLGGGLPPLGSETPPGTQDMYALRASVLYEPTDSLRVLGRVDYVQNSTGYIAEKPPVINSTAVNGVTTICPAPGSYFGASPATWNQVPSTCGYAPFAPAAPFQLAYAAPDTYLRERLWRESLEGKYQFSPQGPTLRLFAGAQFNTEDYLEENTASTYYTGGGINGVHEHALTFEADLLSPTEQRLQWVVGSIWWQDVNNFLFANPGFTGGAYCGGGTASGCAVPNYSGIALFGANSKENYALFGNLQYHISDKLKVEGGVRETWDFGANPWNNCPPGTPDGPTCQNGNENAFHFFAPNPSNPDQALLANGQNSGFPNWGEYGDRLFTWMVSADYSLTRNNFLYAEVATGAKAGGIQNQGLTPDCHGGVDPAGVTPACFQPEKDTDFELGDKVTLLDNHAEIQADAFYTKYKSMQVQTEEAFDGQESISNAGAAHIQGVELAWHVHEAGLLLGGNASYVKSSFSIGNIVDLEACDLYAPCYSANHVGQCAAGQPNGGVTPGGLSGCFNYTGGVTIDGKFLPYAESVNNQQLPFSPTFQGNLTLAYSFALPDSDVLTPRLDLSYQGKQSAAIYDTPLDLFPSRTLLNGSLTWEHSQWSVQGYVTNLTNETYVVADNTNDSDAQIYGAPRQYGVQVTWRTR